MSWLRSIIDAWTPKPTGRVDVTPIKESGVDLDVNLVAKWKSFQDAIKVVENGVKLGFDRSKGLWFPHKSAEGGTDTLAYGKKLPLPTKEAITNHRGTTLMINNEAVNPYKGITEAQATWLLEDELLKATTIARREWNTFFGKQLEFNKMKMKYQAVLVDKVYNTGSLVKSGKFVWKTLASMILNDDEKGVRKAMVAKYKDPRTGTWIPLTRRATAIADAVYLAK